MGHLRDGRETSVIPDTDIRRLAEEVAIIRRLSAEPYIMAACSRMEAIIDPEMERMTQAARRKVVESMLGTVQS